MFFNLFKGENVRSRVETGSVHTISESNRSNICLDKNHCCGYIEFCFNIRTIFSNSGCPHFKNWVIATQLLIYGELSQAFTHIFILTKPFKG